MPLFSWYLLNKLIDSRIFLLDRGKVITNPVIQSGIPNVKNGIANFEFMLSVLIDKGAIKIPKNEPQTSNPPKNVIGADNACRFIKLMKKE